MTAAPQSWSLRRRAVFVFIIVCAGVFLLIDTVREPEVESEDSVPARETGDPRVTEPEQQPATTAAGAAGDPSDSMDHLRSLLTAGDYASAVSLYESVYQIRNTAGSAPYRELLLDHGANLIQRRRSPAAIELLSKYVALFYRDVDALIILGRAYRDAGQTRQAVDAFQEAYVHEHRTAVAHLILTQQNSVMGELVQELKDAGRRRAVIDLYEQLTRKQPEVPGYFIGLANAHLAAGDRAAARRVLTYVSADLQVGAQARSMIRQIDAQ